MIGRLLRSADFERVLRTRTRASSTHFAIHHLPDRPGKLKLKLKSVRTPAPSGGELSTATASAADGPVDESVSVTAIWLGMVVPKRHARRSPTRSLIKRQIRDAVSARAEALLAGLWIVRLRAAFDHTTFPSAASDALRRSARAELELVLSAATQRAAERQPTVSVEMPYISP